MQRQDPRANQTGGNDDRSGRGLDQCGDEHAQNERLEGIVRHFFHGELQRAGRILFQRISHQPHAVQEHGKAAQKGDHIKYIHKEFPAFSLFILYQDALYHQNSVLPIAHRIFFNKKTDRGHNTLGLYGK